MASSAGNHGLGLAFAASKLGATVTVVVPTGASAAKVSALQQFDVRLVLHGEGYREAETYALELAAEDGSRYVSPYNDPDVIAGQATLARELLEQVPDLGTVVVPCGGGGLLAGVIIGLEGTGVRVVGVESEASPSMSTALAAGAIVPIEVEPTVADGLAGNLEPGCGHRRRGAVATASTSSPSARRTSAPPWPSRPPRWASSSKAPARSGSPPCGPGW